MKNAPEVDRFVFEELEQRILFSADIASLAPAVTHPDVTPLELPQYQGPVIPEQLRASSDTAEQAATPRHEIVFIDGAIDNARELADQLLAQQDGSRVLSVYILDTRQDGVAQISAVLAAQQDINGIHIISHGSDGQLQLGNSMLNNGNLLQNALAISGWGTALASGGDILLYGCDVAQTEAGQQFVDRIGKLTGADMAASNDLTGSSAQHGDWTMEYTGGTVETAIVADAATQQNYSGIFGTYTVTSLADSGAGSLRDAIDSANASSGIDTIRFGVGAGTISLTSALPQLTDQVIIDGRTATGYAGKPIIEINGNGVSGSGFFFSAPNSALYGLSVTNFGGNGVDIAVGADNFTLQGNYIGVRTNGTTGLGNGGDGVNVAAANVLIGGNTAAARNVISANTGDGIGAQGLASNLAIYGNYLGTNAAGTGALGNVGNGIALASSNNTVGGTTAGIRNLISANGQNGIVIVSNVTYSTIQGNWIGLDASGNVGLGNSGIGIWLDGAAHITVGGTSVAARNIVSDNGGDGIWSSGDNNVFLGNYVGTNSAGTAALGNGRSGFSIRGDNNTVGGTAAGSGNLVSGNQQEGIYIQAQVAIVQGNLIGLTASQGVLGNIGAGIKIVSGSNHVIGGTAAGAGNTIYYNGAQGVLVQDAANGVSILGNEFYQNGALAIDLGTATGVTPNDTGDGDGGPNNLQNYAVISAVQSNRVNTHIQGTLNSTASRTFRIEFYASNSRDGSGYGEGQVYLGFINVTTDASGNASFNASVAGISGDNLWMSSTTTDTTRNETSEFSLSVQATILNAAPQGNSATITTNEDTGYALKVSDFSFTDPDNNTANGLASVTIISLPAKGSLTLNGVAVTAGASIVAADIAAGKLVYTPLTNENGNSYTSFGFRVRDNGGTANGGADTDTTTRTLTFNVTPVNDAPVINLSTGSASYTENAAPVAVDNALTVSDVDSATLASATVRFVAGFSSGQDVLAFTNTSGMGNISASYNAGTGVLSLSSSGATATVAQWQAALRAVTYSNTSNNPGTAARTIGFSASDGASTSVEVTRNLGVTAVNDAPTVTTSGGTTSYTEGGPALAIDNALTVNDVDNTTLASAVVTISSGYSNGQDTLAFTNTGAMGNISASWNTLTGALTLTSSGASATLAQWQTALRAVTYANSSQTPDTSNRTVSFVVQDNSLSSNTASKTVSVTAVNSAAVVVTSGGTTSYTEGAPAQVIDGALTVTDVDSSTLASATVKIGTGFASGQDVLAFAYTNVTAMGNISGSYNAATGTLTLTSASATATLAQWQTALRAVTYANSSQAPSTADRTISFVVNDGGLDSAAASKTVSVAAVDQAPVMTTSTGTTAYTENAGALAIDNALTLSDVDNTTLASATVRITGGFSAGQDSLGFAYTNVGAMGNISASYNAATGTLTLTSSGASATLLQWTTALRAVTYSNSSDAPDTTSRTVSFVINDGTLDSNTASKTVSVTAVNDAPLVTTSGGVSAYTEKSAALVIDSGITVSDPDTATLASATASITSGFVAAQDVLAFAYTNSTEMGNIAASYDAATGVLLLTSAGNTASMAQWQAALRAVTYSNGSDNPDTGNRVISFSASDGALDSTPATRTVSVTAVNDAPLLSTSPGTTSYIENAPALVIDNGITLSDVDSTTLASATVRFTSGFAGGQDQLGFAYTNNSAMGNISASYNAGTGVLTLTSAGASATLAQWQTALRAITYANSSDAPSTTGRTISFVINDGSTSSSPATRNLSVTAVNDAPVGTNGSVSLYETEPYVFAAGDFGFTDPLDAGANTLLSVIISSVPTNGLLTNNGLAVSNGDVILKADIDAGKLRYTYSGSVLPPQATDAASLTFRVRDDGGLANGGADTDLTDRTMAITINPVNHAPAGSDHTLNLTEDTPYTFATGDFGFTDPYNTPANTLATVQISSLPASGSLTLGGAAVLSGDFISATDITAGRLVYTPAADVNGTAAASFGFRVRDNGGTAHGGVDTDTQVRNMRFDIAAVNDAPVLGASAGSTTYTEKSPATAVDPGMTVSDVDNTTLASAQVVISAGYVNGQDSLALAGNPATMGDISASWNAATGALALTSASGNATLAQWQAALRAVTFVNSSDDPLTGNRSIAFTISDGAATSSSAGKTVQVAAVNDAPVLSTSAGSLNFVENSAALVIDPNLVVSDVDNTTLSSATVQISGGFVSGQDLLALTLDSATMGNISASYNAASGTLALNSAGNSATKAQWQAALRAVTYQNSSDNPSAASRTVSFMVNDGAADSNVITRTVTVTPVNDAPVLATSAGTSAYVENAAALPVDTGLTLNDVDNSTLGSATVSITGGFAPGQDVLAFANSGSSAMGNITASYDASTGVLTLFSAGSSATLAQWQTALRAVTYANSSDDPSTLNRSIVFVINDGSLDSSPASKAVSVTAVNDAPVLTPSAGSSQYVENAAPRVVDGALLLTDADNTTLASATVSIASNFTSAQDRLAFANTGAAQMGNISASYNAATGVLTMNSAGATATVAQWQAALRAVTYANSSEAPNTASRLIVFRVSDGSLVSSAANKTMIVTSVNDAPAGKPFSVTVNEDTPYTFKASDFGFSDTADGNSLLSVIFTTLPSSGVITDHGAVVGAGINGAVLAFNLDAGYVVYTPGSNFNGTITFTFQVRDAGGTANGGVDVDLTPRLVTFNILSVNDAPTAAPGKITLVDNKPHVFTVADFGFSDSADTPANNMLSVQITSVRTSGSLTLNGVVVVAGTVVLRSDIDAGQLMFAAPGSGNVAKVYELMFLVRDNGGTLRGGVDTDGTARLLQLSLPVVVPADSGFVTLPSITAGSSTLGSSGSSASELAFASVDASNKASATAAKEEDDESKRVVIPITAGARSLDIEVEASTIRANIARFLDERSGSSATPLVINLPASSGTSDSGSLFRKDVVVETPMDRRNNLLTLKNGSSGDSALGAIMPAKASAEASSEEYSALRATAHRIETAIAVSAIGTIWVVARKAALVASLLSSVPAWMRLDPLPILATDDEQEEELGEADNTEETAQAESVEHLFTVASNATDQGNQPRPR